MTKEKIPFDVGEAEDAGRDENAPENQADAGQYRPHSMAEDEEALRENDSEFADRIEPDMSDAEPHTQSNETVDPQLKLERTKGSDIPDAADDADKK